MNCLCGEKIETEGNKLCNYCLTDYIDTEKICICGNEIEDDNNYYCDYCIENGNEEYDPDYEAEVDHRESTEER